MVGALETSLIVNCMPSVSLYETTVPSAGVHPSALPLVKSKKIVVPRAGLPGHATSC